MNREAHDYASPLQVDLRAKRLVLVKVDPLEIETFMRQCEELGGLSEAAIAEDGVTLLRLPLRLNVQNDYVIDPGISIKVRGTLRGFSDPRDGCSAQ
jgi:hypothetical protein